MRPVLNRIYILVRQSARNPFFTMVQILGLSVGFFVLFIIGMYANHEFGYDRHHPHYDRIYRLIQISNYGGIVENSSSAPFPVKKAIETEYPHAIEAAARVFNYQNTFQLVSSPQNTSYEPGLFFVDPELLSILNIPVFRSNGDSLLTMPYMAAITQSAAKRFFNNSDPVGKTLIINNDYSVQVEAVVEDPPSQTHFPFTILVSMGTVRQNYSGKLPDTWAWNPCWTYVKLKKGLEREAFETMLLDFSRKHLPSNRDNSSYFKAQPIAEIHLLSRLDYEITPNGSFVNVLTISALALFIFILAIINYINLTTAQTFNRLKEIVVRKVVGVSNPTLILECIVESLILSMFAILLSLVFIELFLSDFNQFVGTNLKFTDLFLFENLLLVLIALKLTSILGGIYPSFTHLRLNIPEVLKGKFPQRMLQNNFRKILVVIQVAIALGLLVVSQVVYRQYRFLITHQLGFRTADIVVLPTRLPEVKEKYHDLISELRLIPEVTHITGMDYKIGIHHNFYLFQTGNGWQYFPALIVNDNFIETFDIQIIAGRSYNSAFPDEGNRSILISESMCRYLKLSPQQALGKKFTSWRGEERIVGVFKDFIGKSLHYSSEPFVIDMRTSEEGKIYSSYYTAIRVQPQSSSKVFQQMNIVWNRLFPKHPFQAFMLNDEILNQYRMEKNLVAIITILTMIALLMAMVGVFGFGIYQSSRREKEVAIRIVFGADLWATLKLLLWEYLKLIFFASLAAFAVSYFAVETWLSVFSVSVGNLFVPFFYTFILTFILLLAAIVYQSYRFLKVDPAAILKNE